MRRDRASERRSNGAVVSDAVRAHSPLLKGVGRSGARLGDHKVTFRVSLDAKFASDSPLEGNGFEPSVPRQIRSCF